MSYDPETELVNAARRCARLVDVMKRQGARRGRRAETVALVSDLVEVRRLAALVCAGDAHLVDLARRFDRVAARLLEEIDCTGKAS